jgi:hypothetical protein
MKADADQVRVVRDFILGAGGVCSPCKAAIRREGEFDAVIANVLTVRTEEPEPAHDERILSTMAAAFLLFVGACCGMAGSALFVWLGGLR